MNELNAFFDEFQKIKLSYGGGETDWANKHRQLIHLHSRLMNYKIVRSKHSTFYTWIYNKLMVDIAYETNRVGELANRV